MGNDFSRQGARAVCLMSRASVVSRIIHDSFRHIEPFQLELLDQIQVEATAASDVALRTLGACLLGGLAMPTGYHPLAMLRTKGERKFYGAIAETGDSDRFFQTPPENVS